MRQVCGLTANPAVLQHLSVVFESENPTAVRGFWQRVLDCSSGEDGGLADPAGGRLLEESDDRWRIADPEGNEVVIVRA